MFRMKNKTFDKGNPQKMVNNASTYFILLLSLGAMTFFGVCTPQGRFGGLSGVAGKVDGEEITNAEFSRAYEAFSQRLRQQYGESYDPAALQVAGSVLNQLVEARILFLKAKDLGVLTSEDEVIRLLNEASAFRDKDGKFSAEQFNNYLRYNRYSEASFLEEMKRNLTVQKLREFITQSSFVSSKEAQLEYKMRETKFNVEYLKIDPSKIKVSISEDEIAKFLAASDAMDKIKIYYETHKDEYVKDEEVKASHILIAYDGARNASAQSKGRSKDDARKLSEQILKEVKAEGADFTKIAKEKTDEPAGKTSGGDLGYFKREDMIKAFSDAAFALQPGQLSDIVETEFGFHIIKVVDRKEKQETSVEAATSDIARKLIERDRGPDASKKLADDLFEALKKGSDIESKLKEHNLAWTKTGMFAANSSYITGLGSAQEIKDAIYSLKEEGKMYDQVLKSGKSFFIIKLVKREQAPMDKFDDEKRRQLAQTAAFTEGYEYFNQFEKSAKKEFEESKSIYLNPNYLALDQQVQK